MCQARFQLTNISQKWAPLKHAAKETSHPHASALLNQAPCGCPCAAIATSAAPAAGVQAKSAAPCCYTAAGGGSSRPQSPLVSGENWFSRLSRSTCSI